MKSLLGRRPSPALVIALIALFVSLSGVSYGVATGFIDSREIKNNEVRSLDIRNNEIRTRDLRNNQVRGIDIRNSSVQGRDIALNTVTGEGRERVDPRQGPERRDARTRPTSATTAGRSLESAPRGSLLAAPIGVEFTEILNVGGLRLEARCAARRGPRSRGRGESRRRRLRDRVRASPGSRTTTSDFDPGDNAIVDDERERRGRVTGSRRFGRRSDGTGRQRPDARTRLDRRGLRLLRRSVGRLDLDDDRQDHRAPLQALVDELGHVVVEVVLHEVDLGDLVLRRVRRASRRPPRAARRRRSPTPPRRARRGR